MKIEYGFWIPIIIGIVISSYLVSAIQTQLDNQIDLKVLLIIMYLLICLINTDFMAKLYQLTLNKKSPLGKSIFFGNDKSERLERWV